VENFDLRRAGLLAAIALASATIVFAAQQSGESTPPPLTNRLLTNGQIGPAAVWKATPEILKRVYAVCDKGKGPNYDDCFMAHMSNGGASPEAVHITRLMYKTLGEVAIVTDFKEAGPVGMARVEFPLRATDNAGFLLVNGIPKVLDVDNLDHVNRGAMDVTPQFQAVKQRYPAANVWPSDRSGSVWPEVKPLPDGGTRIVIGYPILNGCHTCAHVGLALFGWDFDANGKFVKTTYIPIPPPPKKLRQGEVPPTPTGPAPPSAPGSYL
jgi:hypothetical protein